MTTLGRVARGETYAGHTDLVVEVCGECGVLFALPEALKNRCLRDHSQEFFCPNGHQLHYLGKTDAEKLQEQLDSERRRSGRLAAERDQTRAQLRAQKGVTTKLKKRIEAGVCPCCHRTFQNLARHMSGEHPGYSKS